jgi:hypothetical protein
VGKQLAQLRLRGEDPARDQGPRYLPECLVGPIYVVAGAEVDDQVELAIGEGKLPGISQDQLGVGTGLAEPAARVIKQRSVDVQADQPGRCQIAVEHWQRIPATTAELEHPATGRERQRLKHQRDLDVLLAPVPGSFVGKWTVGRQGGRWHWRTLLSWGPICVDTSGQRRPHA